jgi:RNA polymerase sigma factor (sigma-70 family)
MQDDLPARVTPQTEKDWLTWYTALTKEKLLERFSTHFDSREELNAAFTVLQNRFQGEMCATASEFVRRSHRAIDPLDLVQEMWVKIVRKLGSATLGPNPLGYLYTVLRNCGIDEVRKRRDKTVQLSSLPEPEGIGPADRNPTPAEAAEHNDDLACLSHAIENLPLNPPRMREAAEMRYLRGMVPKQIAVEFKCSESRVSQLLTEAREHLEQWLVRRNGR